MADTLAELRKNVREAEERYVSLIGGTSATKTEMDVFYANDHLHGAKNALIAAQQRRIAELTAGLGFFAGAYLKWQTEVAKGNASSDFLTWAINAPGFLDNADDAFGRAYDLLHDEKGGGG